MRLRALARVLAGIATISSAAHADGVEKASASEDAAASVRGRENEPSPGERALWWPRATLYPFYLVTEYGLRRPLYASLEWADRHRVGPWVDHILHPTPDFSWGPTFDIDLSARSLAGGSLRWKNAFTPHHEIDAALAVGGSDTWLAQASDKFVEGDAIIGARTLFTTRPDRSFFGLGPRSGQNRYFYTATRVDADIYVGMETGHHVKLTLGEGFRFERVQPGDTPSIDRAFSLAALPPTQPIDLARAALDLELDTRARREDSSGARFVMHGAYARALDEPDKIAFLTGSVDAQVASEIMRPDRVLVGRFLLEDTKSLANGGVPFMELATLGGEDHVGFIPGRFRGDGAMLAEISYRYPIAYYVDAKWTASAGNVFARDFSDFEIAKLTGSLGISARTRRVPDLPLEIGIGIGTSRFEEPSFGITSVHAWIATREML